MKKALVGIVAFAGLATVASATTTLTYQVRTVGGTWASSVDANPGQQVEFRAMLSYTGPARRGLQGFNSQPTISNWNSSIDTLVPFVTSVATSAAPVSRNGAVVNLDNAYGRRYFPLIAGIPATSALRGHTNLVSGTSYLRIAQNNTTNWIGNGPTSGTAAANNFNGSTGVTITQANPGNVVQGTDNEIDWPVPVYNGSGDGLFYVDNGGGNFSPYPVNPEWGAPQDDGFGGVIDPNPNPGANSPVGFVTQLTNLEIYRFAVVLGAGPDRTLTVSTLLGSLLTGTGGSGRGANWYSGTGGGTAFTFDPMTQGNILGATINVVPTPGALALLGLGGLVAGRRRR